MATARNPRLLIGIVAAVLVLAVGGYFLHGLKKTRDLQSSAGAGVADATERLRGALALEPGADEAARLDADAAAINPSLARLRAEDESRNKVLADAAELYLVDVQAILKNAATAARAGAAWEADRKALAAHLDRAAARGPGWIDRALALKQKAEKDCFDYRNALGTVADLLQAHQDTQATLRAAWAAAPMIADEERKAGRKLAQQAADRAGQALGELRQLPMS
ncbi:MAG: hypothetical protein ACREVQ_12140 [Burkholderiales bacterium]